MAVAAALDAILLAAPYPAVRRFLLVPDDLERDVSTLHTLEVAPLLLRAHALRVIGGTVGSTKAGAHIGIVLRI